MTKSALLTIALLASATPALAGREVHESETTVSIPVSAETLTCTQGERPSGPIHYSPYADPDSPRPSGSRPFSNIQLRLDPPIRGAFEHGLLTGTTASHICSKVRAILESASGGHLLVMKNVRTEVNTFMSYARCGRNTVETVNLDFGDFKVSSSRSKTERVTQDQCAD